MIVGHWTRAGLAFAAVLGLVAFAWPLLVSGSSHFHDSTQAPLLFGALLVLAVAVILAQLAEGGIDAKALAMLGVLSAVNAALRPLGAGTSGIETTLFLLILAGRVFGPGFGFSLGAISLFASALLTAGVGPWLPYQMFGSAWIGLGAGLLPHLRGKREIALLAGYGAVTGLAYGWLLNLSFWPFTVGAGTGVSFVPGGSIATNLHRFVVFDVTTSLGWDTCRALTNIVLITVTGPTVLAALRRISRRAAFDAPVEFTRSAAEVRDDDHGTGGGDREFAAGHD